MGVGEDDRAARGSSVSLKLVVILIATLATLGVADAALWLFHPTAYHEWLEWVPDGHVKGRGKPHTSFHTSSGYEVRINNLGFRGPDPSWEPAPGTLRILTFGGSSTFNYHAQDESHTWPQRLGQHLQEQLHTPVEVINLALPGYSAEVSKINYLITGRELHPHVVVMYHAWNDLKYFRGRDMEGPNVFSGVAKNRPLWQRFARMTQIGRIVRNALYLYGQKKSENYYTSLEAAGSRANQMPSEEAFRWAERNFADFCRFASVDGVIPVLVSQATLAVPENFENPEYRLAIDNDLVGMTLPILARCLREMRDRISTVAQVEGAIYVDGFGALPHDFDHLVDHVHLTDEGMDRLAIAIADGLLAAPAFRDLVQQLGDEAE